MDGQLEGYSGDGDVFGKKEQAPRSIPDSWAGQEGLAEKPYHHLLRGSQKYLSIGYDLMEDRLTLKFQGVDIDKLPLRASKDQIYKHERVDTNTIIARYAQLIFSDFAHMVQCFFFKQTSIIPCDLRQLNVCHQRHTLQEAGGSRISIW